MYAEAFRIFQMLFGNLFYIGGKKALRNVSVSAWVGRNLHEFPPCTISVAGFFQELPLSGNQR